MREIMMKRESRGSRAVWMNERLHLEEYIIFIDCEYDNDGDEKKSKLNENTIYFDV